MFEELQRRIDAYRRLFGSNPTFFCLDTNEWARFLDEFNDSVVYKPEKLEIRLRSAECTFMGVEIRRADE